MQLKIEIQHLQVIKSKIYFKKYFQNQLKKKRMKTKYGVLNRFEIKLEYWNDNNKV